MGWSEHFRARFAGHPVKSVAAGLDESDGAAHRQQGELVVTEHGVEGGLIYALSAQLRDAIAATGEALIRLDLAPGRELERLTAELSRPRGGRSLANHLRARAGIEGVKAGLLREVLSAETLADPARLAKAIKGAAAAARRPASAR